jgi:hypothetical protein
LEAGVLLIGVAARTAGSERSARIAAAAAASSFLGEGGLPVGLAVIGDKCSDWLFGEQELGLFSMGFRTLRS